MKCHPKTKSSLLIFSFKCHLGCTLDAPSYNLGWKASKKPQKIVERMTSSFRITFFNLNSSKWHPLSSIGVPALGSPCQLPSSNPGDPAMTLESWDATRRRNIHMVNATTAKLSSMHFHGWEKGSLWIVLFPKGLR